MGVRQVRAQCRTSPSEPAGKRAVRSQAKPGQGSSDALRAPPRLRPPPANARFGAKQSWAKDRVMRHGLVTSMLAIFLALGLAGCRDEATLPAEAGSGADPKLPPPKQRLIPTVDVAHAIGWPAGATPHAAPGFEVKAFARDLAHPRWLYVLPNGDVLVAETSAPPQPGETGVAAWVMKLVMKWVGADVPSANRITLLRDKDGDGVAETRSAFLTGLNSPFGIALRGSDCYVANTDAVVRFPYQEGATEIAPQGVKVADLPAGPVNYHWTKNIVTSR